MSIRARDGVPVVAGQPALVGDRVEVGGPLVHVHAPDRNLARRAVPRLEGAWRIVSAEVAPPPHVRCRVDLLGIHPYR